MNDKRLLFNIRVRNHLIPEHSIKRYIYAFQKELAVSTIKVTRAETSIRDEKIEKE